MQKTNESSHEITIEKAQIGDAANILSYLKTIGGESNNLLFGTEGLSVTLEQEEKIINNFNTSPTSIMAIAKENDLIISVGTLSGSTRQRISHHGELALSVRKSHWNIGIGKAMIDYLIEFAKETGQIEIIDLKVKSDNLSGIALYKKCGFKEIGTYQNFFKIGGIYYNAVMMILPLSI
jgi:RimJ/RimL family protein N-acetyltransferase